MQEAGFLTERRRSPTALTLVVLAHGAALAALALAKAPEFINSITKTTMTQVDLEPPPPENTPPPPQNQPAPLQNMTTVPPIIERITPGPIAQEQPPLPSRQPDPLPPRDPVVQPDPPGPRTVAPVRARANLSSYFSTEDYPAAAVRAEAEGRTSFSLAIGVDGRVTGCTVTGSSGNSALDSATCRLLRSRARYTPARDQYGNPASGTDRGSITWRLPRE